MLHDKGTLMFVFDNFEEMYQNFIFLKYILANKCVSITTNKHYIPDIV